MTWLPSIISNVALASLIALAAWFVQRRLDRPAVARILWVLVLVKLVTPPLLSVPVGQAPGNVACALGTCGCGPHTQTQAFVGSMLPLTLLAAWIVGALATAIVACHRWIQFRRLIAHASPAPARWQSLAARLGAELSIRRSPDILMVPGRLPPLVVPGWGRSRLLLPLELIGQLGPSQQEALLLHELMHIKRGDHLVRMLELVIAIVYWWLPAVRSIGRQLRTCEESCCDAAVVARLPQARRDYAQLLLDVLDFAQPALPGTVPHATAMSAAGDLDRRLRTILDPTPRGRRTWPAIVVAVGLASALLPCELHYGFVVPRAQAANSPTAAPSANSTTLPKSASQFQLSAMCCPSQ